MERRLLIVLLLLCVAASAQDYVYSIGYPTFANNIPVELGFVNVTNGNLHLEIPLGNYPQRGKLKFAPKLIYEGRIWKIVGTSSYSWQPTNVPNSQGGWRFVTGAETGTADYTTALQMCAIGVFYTKNSKFVWTDPYGTKRTFDITTKRTAGTACAGAVQDVPNGDGFAQDASGYHMYVTGYTNAVVYSNDGSQVYPVVKDSNGNFFSKDANGNFIDTLGRTPVQVTNAGNQTYYDVLVVGGGRARYTVTYTSVRVSTAFGQEAVSEYTGYFNAIQSITLPDGTSYSFTYDTQPTGTAYGLVTGVTLPTGGQVGYTYTTFSDSYRNKNRWLSVKTSGSDLWLFNYQVLMTCPNIFSFDCMEKVTLSRGYQDDVVYTLRLNNGAWNVTTDYYVGTSSGGTKLISTQTDFDFSNSCPSGSCNGAQYITKSAYKETLVDVGKSRRIEYTFDPTYHNVRTVKEWDYYTGSTPPAPYRITQYTYLHEIESSYVARNILSAQSSITTTDASGHPVAQLSYEYDSGILWSVTGAAGHDDTNFSTALTKRGNVTAVKPYLYEESRAIPSASFTYDTLGNVVTKVDARSHMAVYSYDPQNAYAYLTQTRLPDTSSTNPPTVTQHITSAGYDFSTGRVTSEIDENSQTTSYSYDSRLRLTHIYGLGGAESQFEYIDPTTTKTRAKISGALWSEAWTKYDPYGRVIQTSTKNEDVAAWNVATTCYDVYRGRVSFRGYPRQSSATFVADPCSGAGDTITYDALDRVQRVIHSDSSYSSFAYAGSTRQATSEAGAQKQVQTDAFGRATIVCEQSTTPLMSVSPTSCGTEIGGNGFRATYLYDLVGNLKQVTQGDRLSRTYNYDSLSRVTSESFPEGAGVQYQYGYDDSNNLTSRRRPTSNQPDPNVTTTTTLAYDELNRLTRKEYRDTQTQALDQYTPIAHFYYDETSPWGRSTSAGLGRLTSTIVDGGTPNGTVYTYDAAGNIVDNSQDTPRVWTSNHASAYSLTYGYDPAQNVTSATIGVTGSSLTALYSSLGLKSLTAASPVDLLHPANLFSNGTYGAAGLTSAQFGNGTSTLRSYAPWGGIQQQQDRRGTGAPGTPGQGTITITGSEQYYCPDGLSMAAKSQSTSGSKDIVPNSICNGLIWDQGTVTITINGFSKGVFYGQSSTASGIAALLRDAFNTDTNSPVTAAAQSATLTFTSKATGASSNYAFTVTVSTSFIDYFPTPSFGGSPASGALAGGTDPTGQPPFYSYSLGYRNDRRINAVTGSANFLNESSAFTFDALNHLFSETVKNYTWDFDPYANRWHQNAPSGGFGVSESFNNKNRSNDVAYDLLGNITNDGLHAYTYDAENRIVKVDNGGTATYAYNALGQRVQKIASGGIREYLYDLDGNVVVELGPTGAWTRQEIYSDDGHLATYSNNAGSIGTYFASADWLGTERVRTDYQGNVAQKCDSLPYGDGLSCTGSDTSPVHYTGYERDTETGLDYASGRYYNSRLGRFMTVDPIDGDAASPQSQNRYSYVMGDPINFRDPSGFGGEGGRGCGFYCDALLGFLPSIFGFGGPHFHGSLLPRAKVPAPLEGESLGIPTGMSLPNATLSSILFPKNSGCEFGPCQDIVFDAVGGTGPRRSVDLGWWKTFGSNLFWHWSFKGARLQGESVGDCIDRTQKGLLGNTGQVVLNNLTPVSMATGVLTYSPGTTLAQDGARESRGVVRIFRTKLVSKPTLAGKLASAAVEEGTLSAGTAARVQAGSATIGKIAAPVTAVATGVELGFVAACR